MERLIFKELPLSEEVLKALDKMGFEEANRVICFTKKLETCCLNEEKEDITTDKTSGESKVSLDDLNKLYYRLEMKQTELFQGLFHRCFELKKGYYNGNYHRDKSGNYVMEYYPIPIIEVQGLCDDRPLFPRHRSGHFGSPHYEKDHVPW